MAIGDDISEVFVEVGNPCQVIKSDSSVIDSFFDVEAHPQHSTTFIRQNCMNAVFPYDLNVEQGDAVLYNDISSLVMNLKPEFFQGGVVVKNGYLIQCNTSTGVIYRKQITRTDYKASNDWGFALFEDLRALHYAGSEDSSKELIEDVMTIEKEVHSLYLSAHIDVRVGDRWMRTPTSKPYQIYSITDRKYEGLHKCVIFEDDRE